MEDVKNYAKSLLEAGKINQEQSERLEVALVDLTNLLTQAAKNPDDLFILNEIKLCKITIESLAVVSFNQVADKAKEIALKLFIKGLSTALLSL